MATLSHIIAQGILVFYRVPDWESRLPIHPLYVADELFKWADAKAELRSLGSAQGGRTLLEHLEQTFCDFRCSARPPAGDLRRMVPNKHGIWKMQPVGLRIYGWCPAVKTFAAVTAALETETKNDKGLNNRKLEEVREFIMQHGLEHTVIIGDIFAIFPV
jgi:hypothetical protein